MRRITPILAACLLVSASAVSCYDDSELRGKIETLENTTISSIKSQISQLESKDNELKTKIEALEKDNSKIKDEINALKKVDSDIRTDISDLQNEDIEIQKRISELTKKYNDQEKEINDLKEADKELADKISNLKEWAENLFKNYYTKEEIDTTLKGITESIEAISKDLEALTQRVASIEERLNQVDIELIFNQGIDCAPGDNIEIAYTLAGADEKTTVSCMVDNGWGVEVMPANASSGKIIFIANAMAPTESANAIVFVNKKGIVTTKNISLTLAKIKDADEPTINVGWKAGTVTFNFSSNFNYEVDLGKCDWVNIVSTRAYYEHSITLSYKENPEDSPARHAPIAIQTHNGSPMAVFTINQEPQPSSEPIVFEDQYAKKICVMRFDRNGDGEVSRKEAAQAYDLRGNGPEIKNGMGFFGEYAPIVTSFKELEYFTGISDIPNNCFFGTESLQYITLPKQITSISDNAFYNCFALKSIVIPDNVTTIGSYAFCQCITMESVILPSDNISLSYASFVECHSLKSISIPRDCKSIPNGAFANCTSLQEIYLPEGLETIGDNAFSRTNCKSISFPSTLKRIGSSSFSYSKLESIVIPESCTSIGEDAFSDCIHAGEITINEGVLSISPRAFDNCASAKRIILPASIVSIGADAFSQNSLFASIKPVDRDVFIYATTPPSKGSVMTHSQTPNVKWKLFVPKGCKDAYASWSEDFNGGIFEME